MGIRSEPLFESNMLEYSLHTYRIFMKKVFGGKISVGDVVAEDGWRAIFSVNWDEVEEGAWQLDMDHLMDSPTTDEGVPFCRLIKETTYDPAWAWIEDLGPMDDNLIEAEDGEKKAEE